MDEKRDRLEGWFILELFGHSKIAGRVQEVALGGDVLLRVDVPEIKFQRHVYSVNGTTAEDRTIAAFTKFYSPKSVFAMTPVSEETARAAMQSFQVEPVQPFVMQRALPAPSRLSEDIDEYFDGDEE